LKESVTKTPFSPEESLKHKDGTTMMTFAKIARLLPALALLVVVTDQAKAASSSTYLSLGDSIAYGPGTTQDNGQGGSSAGFVSPYVSALASVNGGVAPNVINLALPGETAATFNTTDPNFTANSNYYVAGTVNGVPQASQESMLFHYVAVAAASGSPVTNITISFGMTDLMNLLNAPGFSTLTQAQQSAQVQAGLAQISGEYSSILTLVHTLAPNAKVDLIGAYNPFNATPNSPLATSAASAVLGLNNILQSLSQQGTGSTYINTYSAFLGNEGTFTNILSNGSVEPTAAGFSAIGALLSSTVVPEPGTVFLAAFGVIGLAGHAWQRRRAA
jgi:lysophospholipase L1-like esterase